MACKVTLQVVSNAAIVEERDRYLKAFAPAGTVACRNASCSGFGQSVAEHPEQYQRFGTTSAGSARFRCGGCGRTFSTSTSSTRRLRQPENTVLVLRLLMNKSPMRRICEVADISPRTLYQRIDLLHDQLGRLAAQHERLLLDGKTFPRMHLAVDRQDHVFNWGSHLDRRTVALRAIASAEARTGYVLAQHLNYDPDVDPWEAEIDARASGDRDQPQLAFHKWARVRLPSQYARNADELSRIDPSTAAPARGVQVHESYSMVAHFLFLERLLRGVEKLQFSLDQEPLIRMACLLSFADRVRAGQVLAYLVRIDKDLTVEERKAELSRAALAFERARQAAPDGDDFLFAASHFRVEHERLLAAGVPGRDRWISHPLPSMNEPKKGVLCLTAAPGLDLDRLGRGYVRASLNAIDRFFMQVRRRVSPLERGIATSSNSRRVWHGYSAYNPEVGMKLLSLFRTYYNYHLAGQDKKTPAQRLGLSDRAWTLEHMVNFAPR